MFSFRLVSSLLAFVMVVYLLRHYIFTAIALIYGRASENAFKRDGDWEPNLSVVVPAHNEERVIGRLLERIDEFTYPKEKLQVVVVDDGSTDNTGKIIEDFAKKYAFIKPLHRHSATGKAAALNEALKQATGEIIYSSMLITFQTMILLKNQTMLFLIQRLDSYKEISEC